MGSQDTLTTDEVREAMEMIFLVVLGGPICVIGIACNVINIIIFVKQGFNESINISLCGLAASDLGTLLFLLWKCVCYNPLFQNDKFQFDPLQIQFVTSGIPAGYFLTVTYLITVFITFERCICISIPLKVKDIMKPRRTLSSIFIFFSLIFVFFVPAFSAFRIKETFETKNNRTMYVISYINNGHIMENVSFSFYTGIQFISLILVLISTGVIIKFILSISQWRKKIINGCSAYTTDHISQRDKRVVKMVTLISCIFIACNLPSNINVIVMIHLSPHYSSNGIYKNTYRSIWSVINLLEVINSSVSILVYYNMSSKFRTSFNKLFVDDLLNK